MLLYLGILVAAEPDDFGMPQTPEVVHGQGPHPLERWHFDSSGGWIGDPARARLDAVPPKPVQPDRPADAVLRCVPDEPGVKTVEPRLEVQPSLWQRLKRR
jgi:hypothetical protein